MPPDFKNAKRKRRECGEQLLYPHSQKNTIQLFLTARQALVGLGLLHELPRLHTDTPHSARPLWTSDRLVAETST